MNKKIVLVGIVALVIALTGGTYFLNSAQTKRDDTKIHIVEVFKISKLRML